MDIKNIIVEILARNQFVSLPGMGSFVAKYHPARLSADGKTFDPPKQEIIFDPSRTFNDEAIENYLVESSGATPTEAKAHVENFIASLKAEFESGNEVTFRGIGVLKRAGESNIILEPFDNEQSSTVTLGLKTITVEPKQKETINKKKTAQGTETRGTRKVVVFTFITIIAIAVFLALYFIDSLRVWEKEWLASHNEQPRMASGAEQEPKSAADSIQPENAAVNLTEGTPVQGNESGAEASSGTNETAYGLKTYYIIIGSFNSLENAQRFAQKVEAQGLTPEIVEGNGNFRVSRGRYTNRSDAFKELGRLRHNNPKETAWILVK